MKFLFQNNEEMPEPLLDSTFSENIKIVEDLTEILSVQAQKDAFTSAMELKNGRLNQFTSPFMFSNSKLSMNQRNRMKKGRDSFRKNHNKSVDLATNIKSIPYENLKIIEGISQKLKIKTKNKKDIYKKRETLNNSSLHASEIEKLRIDGKFPQI